MSAIAVFLLVLAFAGNSPAQVFTTLASFNGTNGIGPSSPPIQGFDGNFYGTTGSEDPGTFYRMTPAGALTSLYSFCSLPNCADGAAPFAAPLQAMDGNFYGTTDGGGTTGNCYGLDGCGTIYKITPQGVLTTLYTFCARNSECPDGASPSAGLIQASDGNFYGTTYFGGTGCGRGLSSCGTIFRISPEGTFSTLYDFQPQDGFGPAGTLVQGTDGALYGTTANGGTTSHGTVFKITLQGDFTSLYSFCAQGGRCIDGSQPFAGLTLGNDGNFYGTTSTGGIVYCGSSSGCGTIFRITPQGALTTLRSLTKLNVDPVAGVIQGTDQSIYGTTAVGGYCYNYGCGTIYSFTLSGAVATLYRFCSTIFCETDGDDPNGLIQGTDGIFYGTTCCGGSQSAGTVFSLSLGLAPFVATQPTIAAINIPVIILGSGLTGSTSVTFNGTSAAFNIVSDTEIATSVPAGATTGKVQVTTPSGTLTSNTIFRVR